jgi:hypothetical protein
MNTIDTTGKIFVENIRDKSLEFLQTMFDRGWKAPDLQQ